MMPVSRNAEFFATCKYVLKLQAKNVCVCKPTFSGMRNAGHPPASAFKIPELGEEFELATSPTSITHEQFWV